MVVWVEFEQIHGFGSDLLAICYCVGREARWEREWGGYWLSVGGSIVYPMEAYVWGNGHGDCVDIFNIRIDEFSNHRCIS